jgi:serine/threonine protein phosphatase 1
MVLELLQHPSVTGEGFWASRNGGAATRDSFHINSVKDMPTRYKNWLHALKLYAYTDGYVLSHAGVNLDHPKPFRATDTNAEHILWNRDSGEPPAQSETRIICGHTPMSLAEIKASIRTKKIYIDGGCAYGGHLVAFNLNDNSIMQLKNID